MKTVAYILGIVCIHILETKHEYTAASIIAATLAWIYFKD